MASLQQKQLLQWTPRAVVVKQKKIRNIVRAQAQQMSVPVLTKTVPADPFKCWLDESNTSENDKLVAKLRLLQASIADRKELHSIIAEQRDDWNKLFQGTLRLATISAVILAAGHATLPAGVIDVLAALVMAVVNKFQPSQLAEEQRSSARQFGYLWQEIEATLKMSTTLREDSSMFIENIFSRYYALDQAYPLPLTPGGLPKFPTEVSPPVSGTSFDMSQMVVDVHEDLNGWTREIEQDLIRILRFIESDIENYKNMGKIVLNANKVLAVSAPLMALVAGVANFVNWHPMAASLLGIGAFFAGSFSHDTQLGMIFEMYRNSAGYYEDVKASIQRVLRMPVELREDGEIFHERIVLRLGRRVGEFPSVPDGAQTASALF